MGSLFRFAAGVVAAMGVSCSMLVDTSGLSGARSEVLTPTGTTDGQAGSVVRDASTDGGDVATPAPSGCAGSTDFLCADFDDGAVDDGWAEQRASGGGAVTLGDMFVSAPRSFRGSTPGGGGIKQARLIADIPNLSPKRVVASMHMMLCDAAGSSFELVKIQEATGGGGIKIFHGGDGARAEIALRSRPSSNHALAAPLPVGRWAHMVIDARYDTERGALAITIDGATVLDEQDLPTFDDPITGFFVGLWTDRSANACTVQLDDVRLRFEP